MKKLTMIIAAVAIGFVMTSCGNKEKDLMNKATELYSQAETELNAIDNCEGFATFCQNFKQKLDDFTASYSDMKLSQETQDFLTDKDNALKQLSAQKASELFTPYLEKLESFNIIKNFGILSSIEDEDWDKMDDEKAEKVLKMAGINDVSSSEEVINAMKNQMSTVIDIDPAASDEEFEKAFEKWWVNTIGFDPNNASDEEMDKAMENWTNSIFGFDPSTMSKEDQTKAFEEWKNKNNAFFESFDKSSEFMSKELKERGEKLKEDMELTYELLLD